MSVQEAFKRLYPIRDNRHRDCGAKEDGEEGDIVTEKWNMRKRRGRRRRRGRRGRRRKRKRRRRRRRRRRSGVEGNCGREGQGAK